MIPLTSEIGGDQRSVTGWHIALGQTSPTHYETHVEDEKDTSQHWAFNQGAPETIWEINQVLEDTGFFVSVRAE